MYNKPTKEGFKKYTNGLYEDEPCICTEKCDNKGPCKGRCGCEACNMAYNDFLSMPEPEC